MVIFRFSNLYYLTMLPTVKQLYLLISVLAGLWQRTTSLYGSQTSLHSILISLFFHFHRNVPHSFSLFDCISLSYFVFQDKVFMGVRLKDFSWPLYYFQVILLSGISDWTFLVLLIYTSNLPPLDPCQNIELPVTVIAAPSIYHFFRHLHSIKSKPVKHLRAKG